MATRCAPTELEKELAFFDAQRKEWLVEHLGKWALVKGEELVDTFDTSENAYTAGVKRFGAQPFLVKQITPEDPPARIPVLSIGLVSPAHP